MSTSPRVTIGLPVYNGERYIGEAIESILAQDFTDFELIIGDNASTDDTLDICEQAARRDPRVVVHRSADNRGAAWNYNRLVDLARGEYFKWAAHDDLLEPGFLGRCVNVLDTHPQVSLCYTQAAVIDTYTNRVGSYDLPGYATHSRPSDRVASVILHPSPCLESFGLTRTRQLLTTSRIGPYTSSDRTLFLELALLGTFYEVPEVLFLHRQHDERSVHAYADARERNVWFDPAWRGRRSAPQWRLLREYVRATASSPAPGRERLRTSLPLAQWCWRRRRTLARQAAGFVLPRRIRGAGAARTAPASTGSP